MRIFLKSNQDGASRKQNQSGKSCNSVKENASEGTVSFSWDIFANIKSFDEVSTHSTGQGQVKKVTDQGKLSSTAPAHMDVMSPQEPLPPNNSKRSGKKESQDTRHH